MSRYSQLTQAIDLFKPKSIVEIGTWSGRSAMAMIKQAQKYRKNVQYIGYDLFEDATDITDSEELNLKKHFKCDEVRANLEVECPGAFINLIKGNTRQTLNRVDADFVFIDGGHSLETVRNDYEKLKYSKVIIFDDYYTPDEDGAIPDLELYGCNKLVDNLPGAIFMPIRDQVKTGGLTQMVMVPGERE